MYKRLKRAFLILALLSFSVWAQGSSDTLERIKSDPRLKGALLDKKLHNVSDFTDSLELELIKLMNAGCRDRSLVLDITYIFNLFKAEFVSNDRLKSKDPLSLGILESDFWWRGYARTMLGITTGLNFNDPKICINELSVLVEDLNNIRKDSERIATKK